MTTELPAAVSDYFAAVNALDRVAYLACFSSDVRLRDPYGGPVRLGVEGLHRFFDGMEATWTSFLMTPEGDYRAGERVAVPWQARATARNGKTARFAGVNVFTLDQEGKISQLDGYWDFKAMVAQIT
jgi:ketosteroid isomerase-like protein